MRQVVCVVWVCVCVGIAGVGLGVNGGQASETIELVPERESELGRCIQPHTASWRVEDDDGDQREYIGRWVDTYDLVDAWGQTALRFEQQFHDAEGAELAHHVSLYEYPSLMPIEVHQRRIQQGRTHVLHVVHEGNHVTGFVKLPDRRTIVLDEELERAVFPSALPNHAFSKKAGQTFRMPVYGATYAATTGLFWAEISITSPADDRYQGQYGELWNAELNNGWKMVVSEIPPYVVELRIRVASTDRIWSLDGLELLAPARQGCPVDRSRARKSE